MDDDKVYYVVRSIANAIATIHDLFIAVDPQLNPKLMDALGKEIDELEKLVEE